MNKGLVKSQNNLRVKKLTQLQREYNVLGKPIPHHLLVESQLENIVDIDEIISPLVDEYAPIIRNELERLAGKDSGGDTKHSLASLRKEDCRIKCQKCGVGWIDVSENLEIKYDDAHESFINNLKEKGTIELGALAPIPLGIISSEFSCNKCGQTIDDIGMEIGISERFHRISECTIRSILLSVLENPIVKGNEKFWLANQKDNRKVGIKLPKSNRCLWMNDRDAAKQSVACPECESPIDSACKSKAGKNTVTHKKRVYQYYETKGIEEPHSDEDDSLEEIMALQYNDKIQRTIVEDLLTLASENNSTINIDNEIWIVGSSSSQKEGGSFRALGLNLMYNLAKEIKGLVSDKKKNEEGGKFDYWCERLAVEIIYAIDGGQLDLIEIISPRYMNNKDEKESKRDDASSMIQTCTRFTQKIVETISKNKLERIRNEISRESLRPMIVPPLPWRKDDDEYHGGYLKYDGSLISNAHQLSVTKHPQFEPSESCIDALNALQQTRWGINNGVVKIVEDVLNNRINHYVNTLLVLTLEKNKFVATIREQDYSYLSYDSVREWKRDIKCAKVDAEKQLYHVYNLDYRGRVYTTAHRLDPQGDDVSRALLTFSDPVKINERGWYWLRVHTVAIWQGRRNSSEHEWIPEKGMTLDEMAEWANRTDFIEAMKQIANEPMENLSLWAEGDIFTKKCEGFQRIAITKEFHKIIIETSGKGVGGTSDLPIRQDASTNIYQHMALLIRDKEMAAKVNAILNNHGRKSDVYQLVADRIELNFDEGILSELTTEQQNEIREFVKKRSTAKGPVMTGGYGATQFAELFMTHNGKSERRGGRLLYVWIKNDEGKWRRDKCAHYKSKLGKILLNIPIDKHQGIANEIATAYVSALKIVLPNYLMTNKILKKIYHAVTIDDYDYQNTHMTKKILKKKLERRGVSTSFGKNEMIKLVEKYAEKEWLEQNDVSSMNGNNLKEKFKELNLPTTANREWLIGRLKANDEDSDADTQQSGNELYANWTLPDGSKVTLVSLKRSDGDPITRSDYLRNKAKEKEIIQTQIDKLKDSCEKLSNVNLIDEEGNVLWENIRNAFEFEIDEADRQRPLQKNELDRMRHATEINGDKAARIMAKIGNKSRPPTISIRRQNNERDKKAELRAIPPGFIHSYDACHLRSIVLHMKTQSEDDEPLQFWGVHDCFGVGANDVDEMRKAILSTSIINKLYQINPFNRFPNMQKINDWVDLNLIDTLDLSEVTAVDDQGWPLSEWFVGP